MSRSVLRTFWYASVSCLALAGQALAQSDSLAEGGAVAAPQAMSLSPVVVTASGFAQEIQDAPASISIITREQLETEQFHDLTDALREVPGVAVTGTANEQDIFIRGLPGSYTLILVDGKRQSTRDIRTNGNSGYEQNFIPPLEAIERIEVVRGPMSSLYGSDAMGGVINIITRKVAEKWGGSVSLDGTLQEHSDSGNSGQAQVYLSGPIVSELLGLQLWGRLFGRGEDEIESGWSKADDHDLGGKLTLTPTEHQEIVLTGGYTRLERNATAGKTLEVDANDTRSKQDRLFYSLSHTGHWDFGTTDLSILQEKAERRSWTRSDEEGLVKNARSPETLNTVIDGKVQLPIDLPVVGLHSLVVGGQWMSTELTDQNPGKRTGQDEKFKIWQQALFIEDEWLITDNFSLTGGLRVDDHEVYGAHWSPRGYAVWHPTEMWTIKGGVSTGFRAPDIRTIAPGYAYTTGGGGCSYGPNGTCGVIIGDPDLEPEKSTSYEFSVGWNNFSWLSANATYFYTDFKDKVSNALVLDEDGNPARWPEDPNYRLWYSYNIDDAVIQGVELSATFQATETITFTGSYTYTDSEQKTGTYKGLPLARTPEHLANLRVDWATPVEGLRTWARADYHGKELNAGLRLGQNGKPLERDGTVVAREYDSYLTFDIGANYALTDKVLLSAAVYNVGDKQLEPDAYNTVGDGRRFWLGTTIKF